MGKFFFALFLALWIDSKCSKNTYWAWWPRLILAIGFDWGFPNSYNMYFPKICIEQCSVQAWWSCAVLHITDFYKMRLCGFALCCFSHMDENLTFLTFYMKVDYTYLNITITHYSQFWRKKHEVVPFCHEATKIVSHFRLDNGAVNLNSQLRIPTLSSKTDRVCLIPLASTAYFILNEKL